MSDFKTWWNQEGSTPPLPGEDGEEHCKRMCEIAWSNGEFKAREQARSAPVQEQIAALIDENQRLRAELKFNTLPAAPVQELTNLQRHEQNVQKFLGAQPAPVQEPVAQSMIKALTHAVEIAEAKRPGTWDDLLQYRALLATPPAAQRQWVGLTDEEIDQGLCRTPYAMKTAEAWREGVRWAYHQLKEKNT
jgi:hypothetical protein